MNTIKTHLIAGFLGTGKTTLLRHLMTHKDPSEQWLIVVNEFGEIGIDGAVLSDNGIPVAEIAGGCLCCSAGAQLGDTLQKMLAQNRPQRIMIEASGLAHTAGVIDELNAPEFRGVLEVGAVLTVVDPRQFVNPDMRRNPLYQDQIGVCDVLLAGKTDLCDADTLAKFHAEAAALFPPKALIAEVRNGEADIAWLDTPTTEKPRYRLRVPAGHGYRSQGFTFPAGRNFDGERLTRFFDELPQMVRGLVRAKGVFRVLDTWVWLNWTDGQWGANQVSWRRDSRFELIAEDFDADEIEGCLKAALE